MPKAILIYVLFLTILFKVNLIELAHIDPEDSLVEDFNNFSDECNGEQHCASALAEKEIFGTETLVSSQNRTEDFEEVGTPTGLSDAGLPPLERRELLGQDQGSHVSAMEMCGLQATSEAFCDRMPDMQNTLADSNGPKLCPQRPSERAGCSKHLSAAHGASAAICSALATTTQRFRMVPWLDTSRRARKSPRSTPRSNSRRGRSPRPSQQEAQQHPMMPQMMPQMMPMFPQMVPHQPASAVPPMASVGMVPTSASMTSAPLLPMPPPPMTPQHSVVPPGAIPSMPTMPAMPMPAAPTAPATPAMTPEEVQELLQTLKTRQSELPSDIQQQVQKVAVKTRARLTRDHHSAVTLHSKAREELDNAILARTQLLSNWRSFISDAVRLWQGYASNFMEQEKNLQVRIAAAKEGVQAAKEELARANRENDIKVQEISDEEVDMETSTGAATRVTDTMQGLAASLQNLEKEAEALLDSERVAKRPRKEPSKEEEPGEGPHFGAAG
eukprot:s524_g22.t1